MVGAILITLCQSRFRVGCYAHCLYCLGQWVFHFSFQNYRKVEDHQNYGSVLSIPGNLKAVFSFSGEQPVHLQLSNLYIDTSPSCNQSCPLTFQDISGEHKSQRRDYFGSQKIGLHRAEQGQGCFKSKRKRPRKQANPCSTYPFCYDVFGNDDHWMKSSVMQDAMMGWWVIPKQPRSKNNRPMMKTDNFLRFRSIKFTLKGKEEKKATKKKHQQPEKGKVPSSFNLCEPAETTEEFKNHITNQLNGSELTFVIKKKLFKMDVERNNNRFSMPIRQVRNENFLAAEEVQILEKGVDIEVAMFGPDLLEYKDQMLMKRWNMNGSYHYVLMKKWNDFTMAYGLKEGTNVEAWSFRRGNKLCFALAWV